MRLILMAIALSIAACPTMRLLGDETSLVTRWQFDDKDTTSLTVHGGVLSDQLGPRPPEFPDFAKDNTSIRLDGNGAYMFLEDIPAHKAFRFTNGDAVTLEAWIKLDDMRDGSPMYIIGKGRTNNPKFARDNQNWSLRIAGSKGIAKLSFLFASQQSSGASHWHRWTSTKGFEAMTGWHHVAVAYHFGDPTSIQGWIDGQPTPGTWDIDGATKDPPVVDDDAVWIGSSQGGNKSNSFRGWIDNVAVHRERLSNDVMASRFRRVGGPRVVGPQPELMPKLDDVPEGRVLVTASEGLPSHERWLNEGEAWPDETARWLGNDFLLPRIPLRYDDWGIRASWKAPVLVRMAADVDLEPGEHQILLRCRALSRLWIDGVVVARGEPITKQPPNGEEPITPLAQSPLPGARVVGYHQQELFATAKIAETKDGQPRRCRVVLELVVGGKNLRTETGETCVAIMRADGEAFELLTPRDSSPITLTDIDVEPALRQIESSLAQFDDRARREASASQDEFWRRRHEVAREWIQQHPMASAPEEPGASNRHTIDTFIDAKIERTLVASAKSDPIVAEKFHAEILPILRQNCFRCHGEKDKGGLKMNSRDLAMKGGDSEVPAIVPGDAKASELIERIRSNDDSLRMPPTGDGLAAEQIATLEAWIQTGASWPAPPVSESEVALSEVVNDEAFLRRIYLDTVGVPPTQAEAELFLAGTTADKRERLIDRLLKDERCADHWMSYWLDLLAENPTLLNASLNSTGPFRWFLYDSLRDNKPLDRMVTELILMRGSRHEGGSAGFAMAAENDAPFAAKGHIIASAFLGIELQCARCHDSPYHTTKQSDLYSLAAMFERKSVTVPATSRVPDAFFEKQQRESLIQVSLKPGEPVTAKWPFAEVTGIEDNEAIDSLVHTSSDSRERLAALITSPQNGRFARVMVNRIWKRLIGAAFVEPVHDWEGRVASHPELLDWLASQLVMNDYDLRHVMRLIFASQTYQREATGRNLDVSSELRFFNAPELRRLTAEQIVDSLHSVTGAPMNVEELTFVHDGRRAVSNRLTLGRPNRSWMFASLNNERDRPSLSLPHARVAADVLEAFGWSGSRQKPIIDRGTEPNVLQPGVMANGTLTTTLTRAAYRSELAQLAVGAESPRTLTEALFLRVLSRRPSAAELSTFSAALSEGFDSRLTPDDEIKLPPVPSRLPLVTWFNHGQSEANIIQQEIERRVRQGPAPDPRLRHEWREIYEDVVWSLINHREFVWMP